MRLVTAMLILVGAVVTTSGCGGGGDACVVKTAISSYCDDDYDKAECDNIAGTLKIGSTCEELGYTKTCPNEAPSRRLPSYSC